MHFLQYHTPDLDRPFVDFHRRRTSGDPLKKLRDLYPGHGYGNSEWTREDRYTTAYQGKEYSGGEFGESPGGPLEVITMTMEALIGEGGRADSYLWNMLKSDPESLELALGAIRYYRPGL